MMGWVGRNVHGGGGEGMHMLDEGGGGMHMHDGGGRAGMHMHDRGGGRACTCMIGGGGGMHMVVVHVQAWKRRLWCMACVGAQGTEDRTCEPDIYPVQGLVQ